MYKETVMSEKELNGVLEEVQGHYYDADISLNADHIAIANKQAKITWEARQKEVDEAEQRGIKKVVDWIEANSHIHYTSAPLKLKELAINKSMWQAFLKEQGVE